jgi:transposase-like protein
MEFQKVPKPKTNPETEVVPTPQNDRRQRRRFSPDEKTRILAEADACTERGQLGELLRREGIYSSHLTNWRAQLKREGLAGLTVRRPGPKPKYDEKDRVIQKQERQIARLEKELRISKALIEMQKKAHEILGIALPRIEDASEDGSSSSSDSVNRRSR